MAVHTSTQLADEVVQWFTDAAAREEPYAFFDRLRDREPVHYSEPMKTWVITRYDDAVSVLRSEHAVRNATAANADISHMLDEKGEFRPVWRLDRGTNRWKDGAPHVRLRRLIAQVMNVRNFASWHSQMEQILDETVEVVLESKRMDLMADFAHELPIRMICKVFGIPATQHADYRRWTEDFFAAVVFTTSPEVQERGDAAAVAFRAHIEELIRFRREHPDESLLSKLIGATEDGETLTEEELVGLTISMIGAGHETTGSMIGNTILALTRHPEELTALRANPGLIADVFEEALRYEGSAMLTPRYALEGLEIDGTPVPAGSTIYLILQALGRDPNQYPDPNRFWIGRPDKKHLAFSVGPHFCCGAQLARMESQLMLSALVTRFPGLALESDELHWKPILGIRGLVSLPVCWN